MHKRKQYLVKNNSFCICHQSFLKCSEKWCLDPVWNWILESNIWIGILFRIENQNPWFILKPSVVFLCTFKSCGGKHGLWWQIWNELFLVSSVSSFFSLELQKFIHSFKVDKNWVAGNILHCRCPVSNNLS